MTSGFFHSLKGNILVLGVASVRRGGRELPLSKVGLGEGR